MTKTIQSITITTLVVLLMGAGFMQVASAQVPGDLSVTVSDYTASATITRNTPCTPYELWWGDGTGGAVPAAGEVCIEVIDTQTFTHTYATSGTYTVRFVVNDQTATETVSVPQEHTQFSLADVSSITSQWVDPEPMMADEEYTVYTITLENGEVVTVRVHGFTTQESRHQQFRKAGYTGNVEALLAIAETESPPEAAANTSVRQQLIALMQTLIERLQALIDLRNAE